MVYPLCSIALELQKSSSFSLSTSKGGTNVMEHEYFAFVGKLMRLSVSDLQEKS